jgi:hypothetical protein
MKNAYVNHNGEHDMLNTMDENMDCTCCVVTGAPKRRQYLPSDVSRKLLGGLRFTYSFL